MPHPIHVARPGDDTWPHELDNISAPPRALYYVGDATVLSRPCVAIVGSRHPTSYGERVARDLSAALAAAGACVVSGMAFGVDAAAHRAAFEIGGATAAVLGAGVDVVYPRSHTGLYNDIARDGVVISEFGAGVATFKGCFPRRNRIIAGLCRLTIVVEASARSGSLITAGYASDFGRNVAAVPGPIDSTQSEGTNQLLRDGAHVIASIADALALANLTAATRSRPAIALGADEAAVWDAVAQHAAASSDDIIAHTGLLASRCLAALSQLEVHGLVECSAGGLITRR